MPRVSRKGNGFFAPTSWPPFRYKILQNSELMAGDVSSIIPNAPGGHGALGGKLGPLSPRGESVGRLRPDARGFPQAGILSPSWYWNPNRSHFLMAKARLHSHTSEF